MTRRLFCVLALFGSSFVLIAGCGPNYGPTGKITGRLTLDGKPLPPGQAVTFMEMPKGFLAFGTTDAEGKFEVKTFNAGDMPIGVYKVQVAAAPASTKDAAQASAEDRFEKPEVLAPRATTTFPKKYNDFMTSGIEYEVKQGTNHFDIDLKSK